MDKEKVCSIVAENSDRMIRHSLYNSDKYCVIGLCFREIGVPNDYLKHRCDPGDVLVPISILKDEIVEQIPEDQIFQKTEAEWVPDEPWVRGYVLLKIVYGMTTAEANTLIEVNDDDSFARMEVPEGDSPAERILRYLECQEALE